MLESDAIQARRLQVRKTSATEAMNRLARSYPLLVDLAASDNALVDWLLSASNKVPNELYRDIVRIGPAFAAIGVGNRVAGEGDRRSRRNCVR
jgi:hypothetical protein